MRKLLTLATIALIILYTLGTLQYHYIQELEQELSASYQNQIEYLEKTSDRIEELQAIISWYQALYDSKVTIEVRPIEPEESWQY